MAWILLDRANHGLCQFPLLTKEIRLVLIKTFSRRKVGVMGGCFDDVFLFGPDDM